MYNATIHEMGNGFPDEGDYVGGEGCLWRVVRLGRIETGRAPGAANWCLAEVAEAAWDDCPEGEEFPARVVTSSSDDDDPPDSEDTLRADYELDRAKET